VRKPEFGIFGNDVSYLAQHSLHKFLLPSTRNYDIWHATYQATQYFPARRKLKVVLTVHDLNFLHENTKAPHKIKRELKKMQDKIDRADQIVAISEFVRNDLRNHVQLHDKSVSVIYNGCNIHQAGSSVAPLHHAEGKFIYTIGTITAKKNFHVLPALLVGNDFKLIISGVTHSQPYFETIVAEAKHHGVSDRVIFTGAITEEEKQWYMQHCEVFVFPSIAEGFGLPVIEAMYFGKPVLLSTHTSLPEIGGEDACYFRDFDPESMRTALAHCLNTFDAVRSERMRMWAGQFSWDQAAQQYHALYAGL
jgi:glycosyltransferase involved in cell wall biosynthesis